MILAIALASPLLAFASAYLGHRRAARADGQIDRSRRREETMRMMRWAVDHSRSREKPERATGLSEHKYRLPLDERMRFARLSVKAARLAEEDADEDVRELAATALPWEDEVPAQYAR